MEEAEALPSQRIEVFNTCLRMTAGVALNAGTVDLLDGRIHEGVLEQARNGEQSELQANEKRKQQCENAKRKVDAIREKVVIHCSKMQLHTMVSWFKRPGDSYILKRKEF